MSGFSEQSLSEQLSYEGYSSDQIDYALANIDVDYNFEALESAQGYMDMSGFSAAELQDQLAYEGYSSEQIDYALANI